VAGLCPARGWPANQRRFSLAICVCNDGSLVRRRGRDETRTVLDNYCLPPRRSSEIPPVNPANAAIVLSLIPAQSEKLPPAAGPPQGWLSEWEPAQPKKWRRRLRQMHNRPPERSVYGHRPHAKERPSPILVLSTSLGESLTVGGIAAPGWHSRSKSETILALSPMPDLGAAVIDDHAFVRTNRIAVWYGFGDGGLIMERPCRTTVF